jgi:hypothetical protein
MRYDVLRECDGCPHARLFATVYADDDQARRLLRERWPGEDDLYLVREEGLRFVRVPDQE